MNFILIIPCFEIITYCLDYSSTEITLPILQSTPLGSENVKSRKPHALFSGGLKFKSKPSKQ